MKQFLIFIGIVFIYSCSNEKTCENMINEDNQCVCPKYELVNNKCLPDLELSLWLLDPNADYNKDNSGVSSMICKTEYVKNLSGFCSENSTLDSQLSTTWNDATGSIEKTLDGYNIFDSNIFINNELIYQCNIYISENEKEGLINCRNKNSNTGNLSMNYYMQITPFIDDTNNDYSIKDIYFKFDPTTTENNIDLSVLFFGNTKLYKTYKKYTASTSSFDLQTVNFTSNDSSYVTQVLGEKTLNDTFEYRINADLNPSVNPSDLSSFKVLALDKNNDKFYSDVNNDCNNESLSLANDTYFKFAFSNDGTNNNCLYTYKNSNSEITFCYNDCETINKYVNTNKDIKASSLGWYNNSEVFFNTPSKNNQNKIYSCDDFDNLSNYIGTIAIDISNDVEQYFQNFNIFILTAKIITISKEEGKNNIQLYYDPEKLYDFSASIDASKIKISKIDANSFFINYINDSKIYSFRANKIQ